MSQLWRTEREPSRIIGSQIAVMPGGDVAELVNDSRGDAWARWYAAGSRSWSDWRHVPGKPGVVALSGPYTGLDEVARSAEVSARAITRAVAAELDRRGVAAPEPEAGADQDEDTGSAADVALVAVVGRSANDRQFFRLTAAGLAPIRL